MPKRETHEHVAELIRAARLKRGFATLKELYRTKNPTLDYQTWLHAEAGRRIPNPETLKEMAAILEIEREDLIAAYCKDKFSDSESIRIIDLFLCKRFIDVDTLIEGRNHDDRIAYTYNPEQMEAIKEDPRIRLLLIYTFNKNLKTTISRLAQFFKMEKSEVMQIMKRAESLGLVEIHNEEVTRIHRHTALSSLEDSLTLRRNLLLKELENNISKESYFNNIHAILSEDNFKKILSYLYFAEAKIVNLAKEKRPCESDSRIQIAIIANKINEDFPDDPKD